MTPDNKYWCNGGIGHYVSKKDLAHSVAIICNKHFMQEMGLDKKPLTPAEEFVDALDVLFQNKRRYQERLENDPR